MWNRLYDITMQTPIGARYGTMSVMENNGKINGMLNILKRENSFHGRIRENGDCRITGAIRSLMRIIPYDAEGRMTEEILILTLTGEQESFEISGRRAEHLTEQEKRRES